MFFKKRQSHDDAGIGGVADEVVTEGDRVDHMGYGIMPTAKQLHNGNWIVRISLTEDRPEGTRRYDFAGPMGEFQTPEDAIRAGVDHAKARLDRGEVNPTG